MTPSKAKTLLAKAIAARLPIMLKGAPGIGKSDVVMQAAEAAGADCIIMHPVVSDPTDFQGLPGIVEGRAEFLPYGRLREILQATRPTVVFIDDLGQAPPVVQAACMQLILAREINGQRVPDCVTFIAATNRRQDRAGVSGILEPVKSRFATIVELEADLSDWCIWALDNGMPMELVAFIRFCPDLLHNFKPTSDIVNSSCPRTVANVGRLMLAGITDFEPIAGAAGEELATKFLAFLQIFKRLPNPDGVLLDPEGAVVPDDLGTLYALTIALSARASANNAERVIRYAGRLPDEFSTLLVRDSIRRCPDVQQTRAFTDWCIKHKDVLI